jgi:lipid II:glycine glycyltransferase (peptidoglycan interpeptide bridge formation enzyme)
MGLRVSERLGDTDLSASFLQSDFWAAFKSEGGWSSLRLNLEAEGSGARIPLLVLVRRLGGPFSFAYVPHGPALDIPAQGRAAFLAELAEALRPLLPSRCLFLRFDPPWYEGEPEPNLEAKPEAAGAGEEDSSVTPADVEALRPMIGSPLRRAIADVQPPDTVLVDLSPGEEAILAAMKPKWRYNVRLAEKKGVVVEEAGAEAVGEFYELYRTTSERDRIALHPESYYARLFSLAGQRRASGLAGTPDIRLWIARHEGRALAAIVTLLYGGQAVYLYGASSDEKRNLMPAYALQWAAMRAAKAAGCLCYDLFGIPPTADPGHPMAGLYRFKTGFGGLIAHRAGSWDYALAPALYALFRAAEALRSWWFKDFKKRLGGKKKSRRQGPTQSA